MKTKMRPVEMYCCYDDHTWQDSHFVEVPENTPEDQIENLAMKLAHEKFTDDSIVFIGVYSIPADWSDWDAFMDNYDEEDVENDPNHYFKHPVTGHFTKTDSLVEAERLFLEGWQEIGKPEDAD